MYVWPASVHHLLYISIAYASLIENERKEICECVYTYVGVQHYVAVVLWHYREWKRQRVYTEPG